MPHRSRRMTSRAAGKTSAATGSVSKKETRYKHEVAGFRKDGETSERGDEVHDEISDAKQMACCFVRPCFHSDAGSLLRAEHERGGESANQRNRSADIAGNIKRAGGDAAPDRRTRSGTESAKDCAGVRGKAGAGNGGVPGETSRTGCRERLVRKLFAAGSSHGCQSEGAINPRQAGAVLGHGLDLAERQSSHEGDILGHEVLHARDPSRHELRDRFQSSDRPFDRRVERTFSFE